MTSDWLINLTCRWKRHLNILSISIITAVILLALAIFIVNHQDIVNSDFSNFWLSGYMSRMNLNYYDSSVWINEREKLGATWSPSSFLYPAPMAVLLTPLSWLPLYQSYILWVFLSEGIILGVVTFFLVRSKIARPMAYLFPLIIGIALNRSTLTTLMGGHIGPLYLLILLGVIYLYEKRYWFWGSFLLAIILVKPVLGLPLVSLLSIWLILDKHWKGILGIFSSGLMLLILGILKRPNWVVEYLQVGQDTLVSTFGYTPTLWGVSSSTCNFNLNCSIGVGVILITALLCGFLWLVISSIRNNGSVGIIISAAICLALIFPPYLWIYDQILLFIPLMTIVVFLPRRKVSFVISASVFLLVDLLASVLLVVATRLGTDQWSALVPAIVFFVLLGISQSSRPQEEITQNYLVTGTSSMRQ